MIDIDQLIVVVTALEQRVLLEHHIGHSAAQRPDVKAVIVVKVVDQEFRPLVVSGGNPHVVRFFWDKELCKTPIDNSELSLIVVDHDVMRFDVSVNDAH